MINKDLDGFFCGLTFIGHAVNYNPVWMKEKTLSHSGGARYIENES